MPYLVFRVLDVGQGSANFIELHDDNDRITNTFLIDLGTEKYKEEIGGPSANAIVASLKTMANPAIDALVLSHSDRDHINLIQSVLDEFSPPRTVNPPKPKLTIKWARYGGSFEQYKSYGRNLLNNVEEFCTNFQDLRPLTFDYTSFPPNGPALTWRRVAGVSLYCVLANATRTNQLAQASYPRGPERDRYVRNTRSIVVLVDYEDKQFIVTGDATGVTMLKCTPLLAGVPGLTRDVFMLTVPHHGSRTTGFDVKSIDGVAHDGETVVTQFAAAARARSVTASAGQNVTYHHPSAELLSHFWDVVEKTPFYGIREFDDRHFFTAYFDTTYEVRRSPKAVVGWPRAADVNDWFTVQTKFNVYTTDNLDPDRVTDIRLPPAGESVVRTPTPAQIKAIRISRYVSWTFGVQDNGAYWVEPQPNTRGLEKVRDAMLAGTPVPDIDDWPPAPPWRRPPRDAEPELQPAVEAVRGESTRRTPFPSGLERLRRLT
jgi:hypothetical protein